MKPAQRRPQGMEERWEDEDGDMARAEGTLRDRQNSGSRTTGTEGPSTFFSSSGVWKVSRNFLTWSLRSWSMLRASMARLRNSSTSSSGLRASWAPRLGNGGVRTLPGSQLCPREGLVVTPPSSPAWEFLLVLAGVINALGDTGEMEVSETLAQMGTTLMNDKDMGHPQGHPRWETEIQG